VVPRGSLRISSRSCAPQLNDAFPERARFFVPGSMAW